VCSPLPAHCFQAFPLPPVHASRLPVVRLVWLRMRLRSGIETLARLRVTQLPPHHFRSASPADLHLSDSTTLLRLQLHPQGHRLPYQCFRQSEFPTKRLAQREMEKRLREVNDATYRPRPVARFDTFATRWTETMLQHYRPSTATNYRNHIAKHLLPQFGETMLRDVSAEVVQGFVSRLSEHSAPQTVKNILATMKVMWTTATNWGTPRSKGCVCPDSVTPRLDELRRVLGAATEPYRTLYWLVAETGMRAGEVCALRREDVDLANCEVCVQRSVWNGVEHSPKTQTRTRRFLCP
jgi:Phage integrase, N-terminal SAM-like domain